MRLTYVKPSKYIPTTERWLGRCLTLGEREAVLNARKACPGGKRDTVRAMRAAFKASRSLPKMQGSA